METKENKVKFCKNCKPDHTGKMCYCTECAKVCINKLTKFRGA